MRGSSGAADAGLGASEGGCCTFWFRIYCFHSCPFVECGNESDGHIFGFASCLQSVTECMHKFDLSSKGEARIMIEATSCGHRSTERIDVLACKETLHIYTPIVNDIGFINDDVRKLIYTRVL